MATPEKNSPKSGSTSPTKTSASTTSPASGTKSGSSANPKSKSDLKSAPAKARETAAKAASKLPEAAKGKGKILAASAGVAAAAVAAGVAYFRGGRGSSGEGRSVFHVLPAKEGWQVKGDDAERAVSNHATKKEALTAGRELAHGKVPSQLVVHKSDGSVQESWTYDSD